MENIVIGASAAVGAYLAKDGVEKLLGPTAEYLGNGFRDLVQRRSENIAKIFQKAALRLGTRMDVPGQVPPKVLKAILEDGSFANDELTTDYYGGILASSRSEQGRDDRGARMAKIVDSMSTYQLRTHYLIYSTIKNVFKDAGVSLALPERSKLRVFIPLSAYGAAMDFTHEEIKNISSLLSHILFGLHSDSLIEGEMLYGNPDTFCARFPAVRESGFFCQPSVLGAELFLWAFGGAHEASGYIFDDGFSPYVDGLPMGVVGAFSLSV